MRQQLRGIELLDLHAAKIAERKIHFGLFRCCCGNAFPFVPAKAATQR
jgi:hypothetical protein